VFRSGGAARNTGRISEKRGVTASGVKVVQNKSRETKMMLIVCLQTQVFRDCGRHGARPIDIEDGVALIRRFGLQFQEFVCFFCF
jgi:hypothetical protein